MLVAGVVFAKRIFLIAGVYGLLVVAPMYFLEGKIGRDQPPAITHPEFFYGFIGVTVAWQVGFLILSRDPVRYRPLMIAAVIEKATFGVATIALFAVGRLAAQMLLAGLIDLVLGMLFIVAYVKTRVARAGD